MHAIQNKTINSTIKLSDQIINSSDINEEILSNSELSISQNTDERHGVPFYSRNYAIKVCAESEVALTKTGKKSHHKKEVNLVVNPSDSHVYIPDLI